MKEVYLCSDYLTTLPLYAGFGSDLRSLAEKDYPRQGIFKDYVIPSIDLDAYEKSLHNQTNDCTSDGVIGIGDASLSGFTNRRLLLTELRMGYVNPKNLDFHNLQRKYSHSADILRQDDAGVRIDSKFALIFKERYVSKAQRDLWSMAKEASKKEAANWIAYDPKSFCNYINYGKELPLEPTEETKVKVAEWCRKVVLTSNELLMLNEEIEVYWWNIKGKFMTVDMDYISGCIDNFLSRLSYPPDENQEWCDLIKSEIAQTISS